MGLQAPKGNPIHYLHPHPTKTEAKWIWKDKYTKIYKHPPMADDQSLPTLVGKKKHIHTPVFWPPQLVGGLPLRISTSENNSQLSTVKNSRSSDMQILYHDEQYAGKDKPNWTLHRDRDYLFIQLPPYRLWPSGSELFLICTALVWKYQFILCQLLATTLKYVAGQHQDVSDNIRDSNADMLGEGGMVGNKAGSATDWQGAAGLQRMLEAIGCWRRASYTTMIFRWDIPKRSVKMEEEVRCW